ncbi:MAG: TMEM254 family protein [Actinomycetota bacterium]
MSPTRASFVPVAPAWWVTNFGGVVVSGIVATRSSSRTLRGIFAVAVALHVGEAAYAYAAARRAGSDDAWKWGVQTLGVGFPSLFALHGRMGEHPPVPTPGA